MVGLEVSVCLKSQPDAVASASRLRWAFAVLFFVFKMKLLLNCQILTDGMSD